jgi:hypothetical protein
MKRLVFVSLAALLLMLATALPAAAADPARPFKGSWVGADGYDLGASGCPSGAFLRFRATGSGQFAHLGLTAVSMTHCTYLGPGPLDGSFDQGTITLTAANGDSVTLGEMGSFVLTPNPAGPPPFATAASQMRWWVTGGTGRFAHAAGNGTGTAFDDMIAGVQAFDLAGTISY